MADVIKFPKLKIGDVYKLDIEGELIKCKIIKHEGNNVYKVKALQGVHKGYTAYFKLAELHGKRV